MPGTVLDAKISDVTKTGRSLSPWSQHSSGRDGGKLKDLVYYGRTTPHVAGKSTDGERRTQAGGRPTSIENWRMRS